MLICDTVSSTVINKDSVKVNDNCYGVCYVQYVQKGKGSFGIHEW